MKNTLKSIAFLTLFSGVSQAAITISGTVGTSFKGNDGTTNLPVGSLFLVIADTGVAGFLNPAVTPSTAARTSAHDPEISIIDASITAGATFGGDTILAIGSVTSAGVLPTMLTNVAIAGYESKPFALVYFQKSAATLGTETLANQYYGVLRLSDWTLPASDSGTFTMSATDATPSTNYYSTSNAITALQVGATGFFTGSGTAGDVTNDIKAATFQIVPEPSAALLGAIGALGLLRRRRN